MDLKSNSNKYLVQKKVNNLFCPSIGIFASPDAEKILMINDLTYVELLKPFSFVSHTGLKLQFNYIILDVILNNTNKNQVLRFDNFNLNFVDLSINCRSEENFKSLVVDKMLLDSLSYEDVTKDNINCNSFIENEFLTTQWYENMVKIENEFINNSKHYNNVDYVNSIFGVIFVVSSNESNIMNTISIMEQRLDNLIKISNLNESIKSETDITNIQHFMSSNLLHRYYLVVYDKSNINLNTSRNMNSYIITKKDNEVITYLQQYFDGQGHYIEINSGINESKNRHIFQSYYQLLKKNEKKDCQNKFNDPLNTSFEFISQELNKNLENLDMKSRISRQMYYNNKNFWVSNINDKCINKEKDNINSALYLNETDIDKVKNFVLTYVTNSFIPFLIEIKDQISQALLLKSRGTKFILNSAKEFFRYGKKSNSQLNIDNLTILAKKCKKQIDFKKSLIEIYDYIFPTNINLLKKLQADLEYILQDYQSAYSLYRSLQKDIFLNDIDGFINFSSIEMKIICGFFIDENSFLNNELLDIIHINQRYFESYFRLCYLICIIGTKLDRYSVCCQFLSNFLNNSPNIEIGIKCIIMEQISALLYQYKLYTKIKYKGQRKYAFYMLKSAEQYTLIKQHYLAHLCYRKVYMVYKLDTWFPFKHYVERSYIKSLFRLKQYSKMLEIFNFYDFFANNIDEKTQMLNLQFTLNIIQVNFIKNIKIYTQFIIHNCLNVCQPLIFNKLFYQNYLNEIFYKFSKIKFTLSHIQTESNSLKIVDISECSICQSNPSLNPNYYYSLFCYENKDYTKICNFCTKKYFNQNINSPLDNIAINKFNLKNTNFISSFYFDCTNENRFLNLINQKYKFYFKLLNICKVPIVISNLKIYWKYITTDNIVINNINNEYIKFGEHNFDGVFCLNGNDSIMIFLDVIPIVSGNFEIENISYDILSFQSLDEELSIDKLNISKVKLIDQNNEISPISSSI